MCGIVGSIIGGLLGSKQSKPSGVAISPAPTAVDVTSGSDTLDAAKTAKRKTASAAGYQSTIATSASGDTSTATTNKKTLLGG
jgi:hypothetical protein